MQRIQCADGDKKTKLIITDPKSESSCRQIPIPDCMMSFLLKFKEKTNEYVLTGTDKPIEPRAISLERHDKQTDQKICLKRY